MKIINITNHLNTINLTNLVCQKLAGTLDEIKIKTWIKPVDIERYGNSYLIKSSSMFTLNIIEQRYLSLIRTVLEAEFGVVDSIELSHISS